MNWLADILKDLAISKSLVGAIFVTAVVMYFGPILIPGRVPALQSEFAPYLFALMVLSGCLLVLWGVVGIWTASRAGLRKTTTALTSTNLNDDERAILLYMAKDPSVPIDLDEIDYSNARGTKLEFHQLTKGLERKGLVTIGDWNDNLIFFTEAGRVRALEIQRQAKRASAA